MLLCRRLPLHRPSRSVCLRRAVIKARRLVQHTWRSAAISSAHGQQCQTHQQGQMPRTVLSTTVVFRQASQTPSAIRRLSDQCPPHTMQHLSVLHSSLLPPVHVQPFLPDDIPLISGR